LQPFTGSVPAALVQLMLLLEAMAAPDEQVERLQLGVQALAGLLEGHAQLQYLEVHYASVQLWVRRGKFEKAAAAIDVMLAGLGV
jgi:hypothetical protein